ncbi:MAG: prepilin peptidase [Clostridia bacterium]|nr:prepilin peptidase [Clostridia bacterium]
MDIINVIIYVTIFISGTVFGSFFTLAVYRIPRHEDITHERSYCPKCGHKLQLADLIPVWSYIFLGGKCRYCKEKIRPRYLILEICSGVVFLLLAYSMKISFESSLIDFAKFAINVLFIVSMFIIAGIDKEKFIIPNGVLIYGLVISFLKIAVLIYEKSDLIIHMAGFAIIALFLFIVRFAYIRMSKKDDFAVGEGDIKYIALLGLFFGLGSQLLGLFVSLLATLIGTGIKLLTKKKSDDDLIPFGFYLSIGFTIIMIFEPYFADFIDTCNMMIKI